MKKLLKKIHINREWCKGCGICVRFCPKQVLELDEQEKVVVRHPEDCNCCKLCEMLCPDLGLSVETQEEGGGVN